MPNIPAALSWVLALTLWTIPAIAAMSDKEKAELAPVVAGAKVTLEQGLLTSKKNGKPVSAKFEVENGKPQLSVYTIKDGSKLFRSDRRSNVRRDRQDRSNHRRR